MCKTGRPNQQAFVLSSDKVNEFLEQDNSKFKEFVDKFEKFTVNRENELIMKEGKIRNEN